MTIETNKQNKFNFIGQNPMASVLIGLLLGLICGFLPYYYAVYTPIANVPANSSSTIFFSGKSPHRLGNCSFVEFQLAAPYLAGPYEIFSNLSSFFKNIPLYLVAWALPRIAAKKRISLVKFSITAFVIAALLLTLLFFFTSKVDCILTPSIKIIEFRLYWPTIILWVIGGALSIFTLIESFKTQPKNS